MGSHQRFLMSNKLGGEGEPREMVWGQTQQDGFQAFSSSKEGEKINSPPKIFVESTALLTK